MEQYLNWVKTMTKKNLLLLIISSFICLSASAGDYPTTWWPYVDEQTAPGWEVLPQSAKPGEVILSKRTELGAFSNLAYTPFNLDGINYASIEGLWQGMKYPDKNLDHDVRFDSPKWKYSREEVNQLSSWESKSAGNLANQIYVENHFQTVNYLNHQFIYTDGKEGSQFHLELITRAIKAKVVQNPELLKLLIQTKGLKLRPDHLMSELALPSFKYHEILMKIRDEL